MNVNETVKTISKSEQKRLAGNAAIRYRNACIDYFSAVLHAKPETMLLAAQKGFINATDLADYLTKKGVPFRSAYKISGQLVAYCIAHDTVLEQLPMETYKAYSEVFADDLYEEISLKTCVARRISSGGTGPASVQAQLDSVAAFLAAHHGRRTA